MAQKVLDRDQIRVLAYTLELGGIRAKKIDEAGIWDNPFFCPDPEVVPAMAARVQEVKARGDSLGGLVQVRVQGCPPGLGEPVFDKLDAILAQAVMSVGAVKGVEIGAGFAAARMLGSEHNDPLIPAASPPTTPAASWQASAPVTTWCSPPRSNPFPPSPGSSKPLT